jgi:flavodoxin
VIIIYDSKTGNAEKAAAYVPEGIRSTGAGGEMKKADEAKPGDVMARLGVKLTTAGVNSVKEPDDSTAFRLRELGKSVAETIKR